MIFLQMYDNPAQVLLFSFSSIYSYYADSHKMFVQESDRFPLYQWILPQYKPCAVSVHQIPLPRFLSQERSPDAYVLVLHSMRHCTRLHGNRKQIHMDFQGLYLDHTHWLL